MKNTKIMEITKIAVIIALILLLGLTPVGYIMIGPLQVTTVHAAVILVTLIFGLKDGLIAGTAFGVTSIITALMTPLPFSPIFLNPLVSIMPRLLLPFVAHVVFKAVMFLMRKTEARRTKLAVSAAVAAAISTLVHTIVVILMIWIFRWMSVELTAEMLTAAILSIISINMPSEIILATVVATLATPVLYPFFHSKKETPSTQATKETK